MALNFGLTPGGVHVIQKDNLLYLIKTIPDEVQGKILNPASSNLFQRGECELLYKNL